MSQVHYETASLSEVVDGSQLIAVVEPVVGGAKSYSIQPTAEMTGGESCEPFTLHSSRWTVVRVLHGAAAEGQELEVFPHDWKSKFEEHVDYYAHGLSVSPIEWEYRAEFEGPPWILFLGTDHEGRWAFAVHGSMEGLAAEPTVAERLRNRSPDGLEPDID